MEKLKLSLTVVILCLWPSLAAAQLPEMPDMSAFKMGADVPAADRTLVQDEARTFTQKACVDGSFSSVTMPKPPQMTFADAVAATNAMFQQGAGKIIKQEATDASFRLHASSAGVEVFSFSALVEGNKVKTVGCSVQ